MRESIWRERWKYVLIQIEICCFLLIGHDMEKLILKWNLLYITNNFTFSLWNYNFKAYFFKDLLLILYQHSSFSAWLHLNEIDLIVKSKSCSICKLKKKEKIKCTRMSINTNKVKWFKLENHSRLWPTMWYPVPW